MPEIVSDEEAKLNNLVSAVQELAPKLTESGKLLGVARVDVSSSQKQESCADRKKAE